MNLKLSLKKIPCIFILKYKIGSFSSKSLIEIAKNNLEIPKILPITNLMRQSANNRSETCN